MTFEGPAAGRGKWSEPGVPHKGWRCVGTEDLLEPSQLCEMCESVEIRYVHIMRNDRYPHDLACGEICAGHMAEDLTGAAARDKQLRSRASRKMHFPNRKGWKTNPKGNWVLKSKGIVVTVFYRDQLWGGVVSHFSINKVFTRGKYQTDHEAKLATFDTFALVDDQITDMRKRQRARIAKHVWGDPTAW